MARTNVQPRKPVVLTHEGAKAANISAEQMLRRSVMACMLWEDEFYEDGKAIAERIQLLVPHCRPAFVAAVAASARWDMKLRHAPLLVVREMARHPGHKELVGRLLPDVIGRADEMAEFLSIYWKTNGGKRTLSAQVKIGLGRAFQKFDEHQLAKYDRDAPVKMRDALFLSHAKPADAKGLWTRHERKAAAAIGTRRPRLAPSELLYKKIVDRKLGVPNTWETRLSGGEDKKAVFEDLMRTRELGALAFLRNLRNMRDAQVDEDQIIRYSQQVNPERVLPFRFIAAARAVPQWEHIIEPMMLRSLSFMSKLPGKTAIVVDNSGSMSGTRVSSRSDIDRSDAACALAILIREICDNPVVIGFGSGAQVIPPRRGFALAEAIKSGPGGGTNTQGALRLASREGYDRIIVVTDEQSHTMVTPPDRDAKGYFINVASARNGIGYGAWIHIDGWSEAVISFIREAEGLSR